MKLVLLFLLLMISINARSFGYNKDVRFANILWKQLKEMKLVGESSISTHPYKGLPPHGAYVEMIESKLNVGRTRGYVIILKNYISSNINIMHIINNPTSYLKNISVMFKRKNGYDGDNKNWFYVQYDASGMVMKSIQGFRLAGKIDKGGTRGCISCHMTAPGGDYVFSHDKLASLKEPRMYKIREKKKMRISVRKKKKKPMQEPMQEPMKKMMKKPMDKAMDKKMNKPMDKTMKKQKKNIY